MSGRQLPAFWWRDKDTLLSVVNEYGSQWEAAKATGVDRTTLVRWWGRHELPTQGKGIASGRPRTPTERLAAAPADGVDGEALLKALKRAGDAATIASLADDLDTAPRRVQAALTRLRDGGYRIDLDETGVRLDRITPSKTSLHRNLLPLIDGTTLRVGVVSDTHLGANEEALEQLHAAYDHFAREGITTVLHAGDWTTGLGIFPGQHSEVHAHTFDAQFEHLNAEYPVRPGIQTIGIAGNHDLEGQAGRAGYDPVARLAAVRDDITYLGGMSAWVQVGGDDGPWVHLLHGKGGMSYAYSYKAQKLVDAYPAGRKPNVLIVGHWHVQANLKARGVHVMFPGCFEWQSPFMKRLGLTPTIGAHILQVTYGADGSVVRYLPEFIEFYEGRSVVA